MIGRITRGILPARLVNASHPIEHTQPAAQALQIVELLERWDIGADALLAPFDLDEAALLAPQARLSVRTFSSILRRARSLTAEPGLGFYLGLQKRISRYGKLGLAAMNAATLHEALDLACRFTPVITDSISLRLQVHGELAALVVEEHATEETGDARDIILFSFVVGLQQIGKTQTGRDFTLARTIDLPLAEPSYFPRFAHLLPNVRFDQPVLQFVFDAALLATSMGTPDRAAMRLMRDACEEELAALGFAASLTERVRRTVRTATGFRTLEGVATELHVSPRTLKRKLAAEGTQFSELIELERRAQALLLLRARALPLDAISERLGYSSVTNFARAFRRWTGKTPSAYRRASPG